MSDSVMIETPEGRAWWLSPLAFASGLSCADCDREGCDALTATAAAAGTGIAGVVAADSDVVVDGCGECPFSGAGLELWRVDTLITTEAASIDVLAREPERTESVSGRYNLGLDPGTYLLCVRPSCIGLVVRDGETLTVNIKRREGPTGFFIGGSGATSLEEDLGFEGR